MKNEKTGRVVGGVAAAILAAFSLATAGTIPTEGGHVDTWILVRLALPITLAVDGVVSPPVTGFGAVDDLIREARVHRIDRALPISRRALRWPQAFAGHGLDRTYRFHVPSGGDIVDLVERFSGLPGVEYAEPDYVTSVGATFPNDPDFGLQYGFHHTSDADIDAPEGWDIATGGEVVIAIVDTGIDPSHPDIDSKIVPGYDFINDDADPQDDFNHGTGVGSIAAAETDNSAGMAGVCWGCKLMGVKIWNENGNGLASQTADGIVWSADNGARVLNYSGGWGLASSTIQSAVEYAYDLGVIHVAITHNDNTNSIRYPARYSQTIAVGGVDFFDQRATAMCGGTGGSNWGPEIDVVAAGDDNWLASAGGGYLFWCGTSFAAPHVSGLVGLMKTLNPSVGREEARHLLHSGSEDQVGRVGEDTPGFDEHHGWGRVNVNRTLLATAASVTLRVDGKTATRVYYDTPNPLASSYDFVRGDLAALNESVAAVNAGTVVCLEDDSVDPDTVGNEDSGIPSPGQAFFYVGRFATDPGPGWYGGSSMSRDRIPSGGGCSPACGDSVLEGAEICDVTQFGANTCQTEGFNSGSLTCNATCTRFDTSACALCGNGICEIFGGEDCLSCDTDCLGAQSGNPGNRFCCGDGEGENPVGCEDARCTASGRTCAD